MNSVKLQDTKSAAFLYTNKYMKKKFKKHLLTIASKTIKYLEINLIKEVKGLYTESYKYW